MEVLEAIRTRRAIRRYKKDPVPQELLEQVLEAGRWAPSAGNSQPWDFIVVNEPELKRRVARCFMWGHFLVEAPVGIVVAVDQWRTGCPWQDGAIAAYSMWLAAHGLGLGSCWINPTTNDDTVKELLGIPANKEVICVLSLGYPAQSAVSQRRRLKDIVHFEKYGNKSSIQV
jgi:nitroreductase